MFKDDFKKANDSIHADEKLVERILSQKPSKNRPEIYWKKYAPVAAAAVVVLSTSIAILPKMLDNSTDGIIYSTVSTSAPSEDFARSGIMPYSEPEPVQTEIPRAADERENSDDKTDNKAETHQSDPIVSPNAERQSSRSIAKVQSTYAPASVIQESGTYEEKSISEESSASEENSADSYEKRSEDDLNADTESYEFFANNAQESEYSFSASERQSEPMSEKPKRDEVVLHINSGTTISPMAAAERYLGGELYYGDLKYEDWTYSDYFSYIGTDFNWDIPDDLSLMGHGDDIYSEVISMAVDEYDVPAFDSMVFAYEGSGGRYLSIQTTRNANTAMNYLTDTNLVLSKVNDNDAVIIGNEQSWRCYMLFNGAAYTITGDNITTEELGQLLCSIIK